MQDVVASSLDQPLQAFSVQRLIENVDQYINRCADGQDLPSALEYIQKWDTTIRLSGVSLARTFYMMLMRWDRLSGKSFDHWQDRQDDFEQVMFERVGKAKDTVRRYVMVGTFLESLNGRLGRLVEGNQKSVKDGLPTRHMGDLIAIAQYEQEHGALTPGQLLELSTSPDSGEMRRLLRRFKGMDEGVNPLTIFLNMDGTLMASQNGTQVGLGFLKTDEESLKNPLISKAISRIKKGSNILED